MVTLNFTFEMFNWFHILYIASPFIAIICLYFILRNRSEKTFRIFEIILGSLNLLVLIIRNIDIMISAGGFDPEIIPLQVCHFGNIAAFVAYIFKNKTAMTMLYSFNLPCAILATIFANILETYPTLWLIRPQTYLIGHFLIIFSAIYGLLFKRIDINYKSFFRAMGVIAILLIPSVILNSYFNDVMGYQVNYFYMYDSTGVPLKFMENLIPRSHYGWFTIDWPYSLILTLMGVAGMSVMYPTSYLFKFINGRSKDKDLSIN